MTEAQPVKPGRTSGGKVASSVLVLTVPLLLLAIIGAFAGTFGIGLPEIALLWLVWAIGLTLVWWPRRG